MKLQTLASDAWAYVFEDHISEDISEWDWRKWTVTDFLFPNDRVDRIECSLRMVDEGLSTTNNSKTENVWVQAPADPAKACKLLPFDIAAFYVDLHTHGLTGYVKTLAELANLYGNGMTSTVVACQFPGEDCTWAVARFVVDTAFVVAKAVGRLPKAALLTLAKDAFFSFKDAVDCGGDLGLWLRALSEESAHRQTALNMAMSSTPMDLVVEDSSGRRAGHALPSQSMADIPNSIAEKDEGIPFVGWPGEFGCEHIKLHSLADGEADIWVCLAETSDMLNATGRSLDTKLFVVSYEDITVTNETYGEIYPKKLFPDSEDWALYIDRDGDAVFDEEIRPTTCNETTVRAYVTMLPCIIK